jgi:hypothetical protein
VLTHTGSATLTSVTNWCPWSCVSGQALMADLGTNRRPPIAPIADNGFLSSMLDVDQYLYFNIPRWKLFEILPGSAMESCLKHEIDSHLTQRLVKSDFLSNIC